MATIALFVALGGSSFAAIKISGGQIKNHTISGKKLRRNTLGGGQIKESKLGTVPNAKHAGAADSATFAATAGTAGSASLLGGLGPSAFERSDSVTSFGPLRDTATTIGPRFLVRALQRGIAMPESGHQRHPRAPVERAAHRRGLHLRGGGTLMEFPSSDFPTDEVQIASLGTAPVRYVDGWVVAPSGYRARFSFWFGRALFGDDANTCEFGGTVLRA